MQGGQGRPNVVVRHRKERLAKCSLRGLESREDLSFFRYPDRLPTREDVEGAVLLTVGAPLLSADDADRPLLLIDATWRLAPRVTAAVEALGTLVHRGLPQLVTVYPRRQTRETGCPDPERGLASIEALWAAYLLTGRDADGLLDGYRWREELLASNAGWPDA